MAIPHPASLPRTSASPVRSCRGFTLIELLAALVVAGVAATIVIQLLSAQGRVTRLQGARIESQQNSRAVLELIASELRGADSHSIASAEQGAVTFRTPRAWGVVCLHTHERMAVAFPSAAVAALRTGEEFLAVPPVGGSTEWRFLDVSDRTGTAAERAEAQTACVAIGSGLPQVGGVQSPVRMYAPRPGDSSPEPLGIAAGSPGLMPGTPVYAFDAVRYAVGQSAAPPGWWIRRNTGPAMAMHPLAGPVPESGGLRFRFLDAAGDPLTDLSTAGARQSIRRVEASVVTATRERFAGEPLHDSASTSVFLRNRQ